MERCRTFASPFIVGIMAVGLVLGATSALAQSPEETVDADPELEARVQQALQIVDPGAFLTEAYSIHDEKARFSVDAWTSLMTPLRDQAKQLLLETDIVLSFLDQPLRQMLALAGSSLTETEKTSLLERIATERAPLGQLDFEQMRVRRETTKQLVDASSYRGQAALRQLTADWLKAQDLSTLSDKQLRISLGLTYPWMGPSVWGEANTTLTAEWTGQLIPDHSGETVFSISPVDVNAEALDFSHKQTMQVWIDGRPVIDAKPGDWKSEGEPIVLVESEPVAVRVKLSYACTGPHWTVAPIDASLYWKGPSGPRSIVPETVFATAADGETGGLQAVFRWSHGGHENVESATVPNLDSVLWSSTVCSYQETLSNLVTELLDRFIASESLLTLSTEGEQAQQSHFPLETLRLKQCLALCSSSQRTACLDRILAEDGVIRSARSLRFYSFARLGDPERALDLVGASMQLGTEFRHHTYGPALAGNRRNYWAWNRSRYRLLAAAFVWEHPSSLQQLEDKYLEMADGSCCPPVAYTLAYGYLLQGKIEEWIDLLDTTLDDNSLTGDRRVGWLLARAMAEEIRRGRASRHAFSRERPLAGRAWLDEARLIAESDLVSRWALKEVVARSAASGQWEAVKELIGQATSSTDQQERTAWQAEIDAWEVDAVESQKQRRVETRQAYLNELKRRRQRRVDAGSDVSRYDALIEASTEADHTK